MMWRMAVGGAKGNDVERYSYRHTTHNTRVHAALPNIAASIAICGCIVCDGEQFCSHPPADNARHVCWKCRIVARKKKIKSESTAFWVCFFFFYFLFYINRCISRHSVLIQLIILHTSGCCCFCCCQPQHFHNEQRKIACWHISCGLIACIPNWNEGSEYRFKLHFQHTRAFSVLISLFLSLHNLRRQLLLLPLFLPRYMLLCIVHREKEIRNAANIRQPTLSDAPLTTTPNEHMAHGKWKSKLIRKYICAHCTFFSVTYSHIYSQAVTHAVVA